MYFTTAQLHSYMFLIVGDNFVSPEFNLVLVATFTLAIRRNTFISCLVDIVAGGFLLYATSVRNQIFHKNKWISDETAVYHFLVYCLVSWVASIIIEFKSCKILVSFCKYGSQLSRYDVWTLPKAKVQLVIFLVSAIVTLNACWMMLQFSNAVYKSFEMLTSDPWLLMYYLMAAAAKNCQVFLQGMSCSYGIEHKTQVTVNEELGTAPPLR